MMGFKDNKKEQDPNVKVSVFNRLKLYILFKIYRAYKPYVSVVLHTPNQTPKKEKEKPLEKREVTYVRFNIFIFILLLTVITATFTSMLFNTDGSQVKLLRKKNNIEFIFVVQI